MIEEISVYTPNFIEAETIEQANKVNMKEYRLSERMSAEFKKFIFIKRARK